MQTQGMGLGPLLGLGPTAESQPSIGINFNSISDFDGQLQSLLGAGGSAMPALSELESGLTSLQSLPQTGKFLPDGLSEGQLLPLSSQTLMGQEALVPTKGQLLSDTEIEAMTTLMSEIDADPVLTAITTGQDQSLLGQTLVTPEGQLGLIKPTSQDSDDLPAVGLQGNSGDDALAMTLAPVSVEEIVDTTDVAPLVATAIPVTVNGQLSADAMLKKPMAMAVSADKVARMPVQGALQVGNNVDVDMDISLPLASTALDADKPTPGQMLSSLLPGVDKAAVSVQNSADIVSVDGDKSLTRDSLSAALERLSPSQLERGASIVPAKESNANQILENPTMAARLQASVSAPNINERVQWMMGAQKQVAEIQLDPPELGALQIKVSTQNDQTSVNFVVANAAVKDALEQQMPKLREFFEQQGIDLGDVNVADGSETPNSEHDQAQKLSGNGSEQDAQDELADNFGDEQLADGQKQLSSSLVDLFA